MLNIQFVQFVFIAAIAFSVVMLMGLCDAHRLEIQPKLFSKY